MFSQFHYFIISSLTHSSSALLHLLTPLPCTLDPAMKDKSPPPVPDAVSSNVPAFGVVENEQGSQEYSPPVSSPALEALSEATPERSSLESNEEGPSSPQHEPLPTPSRPPLLHLSNNQTPPPTPFGSTTILSDLSTNTTNIDYVRAIVLSDQNILDIKGIELDRFSSLSMLNLSFNSIPTLAPLLFLPPSSYSPFLTNLDVSHNKLTTLSGVEFLPSLKILRASNNKLEGENVQNQNANTLYQHIKAHPSRHA